MPGIQSFDRTPNFQRSFVARWWSPMVERGILPLPAQTVRRSDITLTMLPGPAISTSCACVSRLRPVLTAIPQKATFAVWPGRDASHTFSCQLSSTLMAWLPPSPPPRAWTWEKPVAWGVMLRVELAAFVCAIPLYLRCSPLAKSTQGAGTRPSIGHREWHDNRNGHAKGGWK